MKKIVIILIALFSVLAFSKPIRADTEKIATMNLSGNWGTTQAVITRSNGKLHIKHTGLIGSFRLGSVRSVSGVMELQVEKNNVNGYVASTLNFSTINESKENDIDIDQGENDTFTFILKVGAQSIGMEPIGVPLPPVTVDVQSKTPTVVDPPKKPQASPITINYVDEDGKIIHDSQKITGNYGDIYDATSNTYKLDCNGYTLDQSKLPNNATGKISSTEQTVTYVYQANKQRVKSEPDLQKTIKSEKWGDVAWTFDDSTGTLTFTTSGTLSEAKGSPWNRSDKFRIDVNKITTIDFKEEVFTPENSDTLFENLRSLTTFNASNLNTSQTKNMRNMFYGMGSITQLDVSHFNTSKVEHMQGMFCGVSGLKSLDVSSFNTSSVTDMTDMFHSMIALESLDLSKWDMSKNKFTCRLFQDDSALKSLKLGQNNKLFVEKSPLLPAVPDNDDYTGYWINIGQGTAENPKGKNLWTSDYLVKNYDGGKDADTYVWQKRGLRFISVPDIMSFEDAKISNRTIESKRKDKDWKMIVEDTRKEKTPWRVTAKLVEPFQNNSKETPTGDILLFRTDNQPDQWITSTCETNVFKSTSSKEQVDYDVSWSQDAGPIIQVDPGTVKADEYKGVIQWTLTDTPA